MSDYNMAGNSNNLHAQQVTIASGASASEMIATQGFNLVGIIMPAAWTAADIGFAVCVTGNSNDLQQVNNQAGNPESSKAVAAKPIAFPSPDALYFPFLQILSVSTTDDTTPVTQGAARTLILLFREFLS